MDTRFGATHNITKGEKQEVDALQNIFRSKYPDLTRIDNLQRVPISRTISYVKMHQNTMLRLVSKVLEKWCLIGIWRDLLAGYRPVRMSQIT